MAGFKFKKTLFSNGLRVITLPLKNTKAVTILILVGTGSKYERKELNGISHLLEHMAFKGTKNRPKAFDIAKELDGVGGVYNAFTGKEYMGFWVKVDKSHLNLACDVLSDMLFNSLFKTKEIEKEKKVIFEEINMTKDDPKSYVVELWEKLLYGDQPAGRTITGSKETVAKISRQDLLEYLESQLTGKSVVIVLAGNFWQGDALSKIRHFFSRFPKKEPAIKEKTREFQKEPQVLLKFKETDQCHLCLGTRTFNLFSPKRYPLAVLSVLLGGIMSSRLFIEVREKRALGYYIYSYPQHYTDTGYLVTQAGVDNKRVKEAIGVILKEYKRVRERKIPQKELKKAKENIKGKIYLSLETSDAWASFLGTQEILKKEISLPDKECAMIDKVTKDDVLKVAQEIFRPEKLNLALIGPFKEKNIFKDLLKL
jgi:predicted Zn-dependent peptidase